MQINSWFERAPNRRLRPEAGERIRIPQPTLPLEEQSRQPDIAALGFEERFALLADREATERDDKRLKTRLRYAGLPQNAVIEDVDTKTPRGLDRGAVPEARCR